MSDEQIDNLLGELDSIARSYDAQDYGLPLAVDESCDKALRKAVVDWLGTNGMHPAQLAAEQAAHRATSAHYVAALDDTGKLTVESALRWTHDTVAEMRAEWSEMREQLNTQLKLVEEWEFRWHGEQQENEELSKAIDDMGIALALAPECSYDEMTARAVELRAQLAAEQAAHQLTRETYGTGAKMAEAVNESLRARIRELCEVVYAERQRGANESRAITDAGKLTVESALRWAHDTVAEMRAEWDEMRDALERERGAHALTRETYGTGAKMAEAVNESLRARIRELCEVVYAERQRGANESRAITDAAVAKHQGAGLIDEPITPVTLEREGFAAYIVEDDEGRRQRLVHLSGVTVNFDTFNDLLDVRIVGRGIVLIAPNCRTMRNVHQLVAMFTAQEAK